MTKRNKKTTKEQKIEKAMTEAMYDVAEVVIDESVSKVKEKAQENKETLTWIQKVINFLLRK